MEIWWTIKVSSCLSCGCTWRINCSSSFVVVTYVLYIFSHHSYICEAVCRAPSYWSLLSLWSITEAGDKTSFFSFIGILQMLRSFGSEILEKNEQMCESEGLRKMLKKSFYWEFRSRWIIADEILRNFRFSYIDLNSYKYPSYFPGSESHWEERRHISTSVC